MEKVRFGIIGYGVQGKFYSAILTGGEMPGIGRIPQPEGCVLSAISVRRKRKNFGSSGTSAAKSRLKILLIKSIGETPYLVSRKVSIS